MSKIELKPCPFCGGRAKVIPIDESEGVVGAYEAYCRPCGASGPTTYEIDSGIYPAKYRAAVEWNDRA